MSISAAKEGAKTDTFDILECVKLRGYAPMDAKEAAVNNGCHGESLERAERCVVYIQRILSQALETGGINERVQIKQSRLTFTLKATHFCHATTLVAPTKQEYSSRITQFESIEIEEALISASS